MIPGPGFLSVKQQQPGECVCRVDGIRWKGWWDGVQLLSSAYKNRLVGLVVKASATRAEDPGFESLVRRDFFGVESYQ